LVAVKIFSLQDRHSWQIEQEVYRLPQMKHKNILTYLGAERRGEGLNTEYWLITEYHSYGSLWDYLKAYTVDWNQLLTIAQGIARGLRFIKKKAFNVRTIPPKDIYLFNPFFFLAKNKQNNCFLISFLTLLFQFLKPKTFRTN
jgi:serine/threonine protein kinase